MKTPITSLVLIVSMVLSTDGFSQSATPLLNAQKAARLDSFLNVMSANELFNGSVLVCVDGAVVYKKSSGFYDRSKAELNSERTSFNLASASKPFTAIAILQLVQAGKVRLEDPISKSLDAPAFTNISVRHLLTHTSGLPRLEDIEAEYTRSHPNEVVPAARAFQDLLNYPDTMLTQPGEKFQYNNANYFLLALLVEKLSGRTFAEYMASNIFRPSGMKSTYVRTTELPNTPRYVLPTFFTDNYVHVDSLDKGRFYTYFQLGSLQGPNNIVSTLEDLALFERAFSTGKLLEPGLMDKAFTPAALNSGNKIRMGGVRTYGYVWNIMDEPVRDKAFFHDGHIVGLTTMIYKNPAKKLAIFYYDNRDAKILFPFVGTIARICTDEPINKISLKKSAVRAFGRELVARGFSLARLRLSEWRADSAHYYFDELEMNTLGYDLLYRDPSPEHKLLSMDVFRLNAEFFPAHANVYDSYGDALAENGRINEAIEMYRKVLALSPGEESTRKKLAKLLK